MFVSVEYIELRLSFGKLMSSFLDKRESANGSSFRFGVRVESCVTYRKKKAAGLLYLNCGRNELIKNTNKRDRAGEPRPEPAMRHAS